MVHAHDGADLATGEPGTPLARLAGAEETLGGISARFDPGSAPASDDLCGSPVDPGGGGSSGGGGGGGGGCTGTGPFDPLLHLLVLIAGLVLLRSPFSF